jgi:hypothetical protein
VDQRTAAKEILPGSCSMKEEQTDGSKLKMEQGRG